jgi:hypothetical protein
MREKGGRDDTMCGQNMKVFDFYCLSLLCCFYMINRYIKEQFLTLTNKLLV